MAVDLQHDVVLFVTRVTLERLNQLEPWVSAIAGDFDEEALKAEAEEAKKQADALLIDAAKERRHTDRLRLKDHGDVRDRRRRSHSRERDRCACRTVRICAVQVAPHCFSGKGMNIRCDYTSLFGS